MTDLDTLIKSVFDQLDIKHIPCIIMNDGKIQVAEIKQPLNCIVQTGIKEEFLDNGQIRNYVGFYLFSPIKSREFDVLEDINPKQSVLSETVYSMYNLFKDSAFKCSFSGAIVAGIDMTTGRETGKAFTLTFDYYPLC